LIKVSSGDIDIINSVLLRKVWAQRKPRRRKARDLRHKGNIRYKTFSERKQVIARENITTKGTKDTKLI